MNITYIASSGNVYNLSGRRILTQDANLFKWGYEPRGNTQMFGERLSYFHKDPMNYPFVLIVRGGRTHRKAILTALHDDFERDIRTLKTGTLHFGEWYCECFVTESDTHPIEEMEHWTEDKINIYVPSGFWLKDESREFGKAADSSTQYPFLDFEYDFMYDYSATSYGTASWITDAPFDSDFRMEIYGQVVNPRVVINGYPYIVYATVGEGETLVIDSKEKTVMCGNRNLFDNRNKVQSVFQKIPSGALSLSWGNFAFKLTLYEERSEPKW